MVDPVRALAAMRRETLADLVPIIIRSRLSIEATEPASRFVLRGPGAGAATVCKAFGVSPPDSINRATSEGERAILRLGPDEWLMIGPEGDGIPTLEAGSLSLVDVGHRDVGLSVSGPLATEVLSSGVMLDLDVAAFPVGTATRTLFTKAEIVLWRRGPDLFHIEVWRSFAPYLRAVLAEAAREYARADRS